MSKVMVDPNLCSVDVPVKGAFMVVKRQTTTGAFQANYKWEEHNNWGVTLCIYGSGRRRIGPPNGVCKKSYALNLSEIWNLNT